MEVQKLANKSAERPKTLNIEKCLPITDRLLLDKKVAEKIGSGQKGKLREITLHKLARNFADYRIADKIDSGLPAGFDITPEELLDIKRLIVVNLISGPYSIEKNSACAKKLAEEIGWLDEATRVAEEHILNLGAGGKFSFMQDKYANAAELAKAWGLAKQMKIFGRMYLMMRYNSGTIERSVDMLKREPSWSHLNEDYIWHVRQSTGFGLEPNQSFKSAIFPYISDAVINYCRWNTSKTKGDFKRMLQEELGLDDKEEQLIASEIKQKILAVMDKCKGDRKKTFEAICRSGYDRCLTISLVRFFGDYGTPQELERVFRLAIHERGDTYYDVPILVAEYGMIKRLDDLIPKLDPGLREMLKNPSWTEDYSYYPTALMDYEKIGIFKPEEVREIYLSLVRSELRPWSPAEPVDLSGGKLDNAIKLADKLGLTDESMRIKNIKQILEGSDSQGAMES